MLNIITPLQKFSKGDIIISDLLRQRYKDLFSRKTSSECLSQTEFPAMTNFEAKKGFFLYS